MEKLFWEGSTVTKRTGKMIYIIKGHNFIGKRHINQLRPRYIETLVNNEIPMEVLYGAFQIELPQKTEVPMVVTSKSKTTDSQKYKTSQYWEKKSDRKRKRSRRLYSKSKRAKM